MNNEELLENIKKLFATERVETKKLIQKAVEDVELKIETIHVYQKKAHSEIMENLVDSNEANGLETKRLKKRVDLIEKHLDLSPLEH